jgi:SAM-dependent methyltransferase
MLLLTGSIFFIFNLSKVADLNLILLNMQSLYKNGFEHIYDEMYQTFIDYAEEFKFYSTLIKKHNKQSVLEIGCGTGNLAKHFINSNLNYLGLDLSDDMVKLSKLKNPSGNFIQADIINYSLKERLESTIITGRTTSYLLTNKAIYDALKAIHKNLKKDGLLCFDFIDANRFIPSIKGGKKITHQANFDNKQYFRESFMANNTLDNFMFNWDAEYYEKTSTGIVKLTEDKSVVRAFTKNEWELFLELNNFKLIEFIDRKSYAFDTYVVVAKKT